MTLTPGDCDAILRECPAVAAAAPIVRASTQVVYGNRNWVPMQIYGTTPAFLDVRNWTHMAEGECFTDRDVRSASRGLRDRPDARARTLPGRIARRQRRPREERHLQGRRRPPNKGANMMGMDQDDILLAPWTAIKYRVTGRRSPRLEQLERREHPPSTRSTRSTRARHRRSTRRLRTRRPPTRRCRCASPT